MRPILPSVPRIGLALGALESRAIGEVLGPALAADEVGYELVLVPEAWGRDAFVLLGHLAARTRRISLGTGIVNVYSRSPAAIAMAAATLDEVSGGRAVLGLGVSGRRVIEGWHGVAMERPLQRLREVTETVRRIVARERTESGFALRFHPPRARIPIYHACLTPAAIRQCGEIADGWLPILATPEALRGDLALIDEGLRRAGRERASFTVAPLIPALVSDDLDDARRAVKRHLAFYLGGMGRFYHEALSRHGYREVADRAKEAWSEGRRDAAAAAIPDDLVDAVALCGSAERCLVRLEEYRSAGADLPIAFVPMGVSPEQAKATLRALA